MLLQECMDDSQILLTWVRGCSLSTPGVNLLTHHSRQVVCCMTVAVAACSHAWGVASVWLRLRLRLILRMFVKCLYRRLLTQPITTMRALRGITYRLFPGNKVKLSFAGQKRPKGSLTDMDTWKRLLQTGGCEDADEVMRAFRRIVEAGAKGRPIPATDILTVRGCGRKMVENFRAKALQVFPTNCCPMVVRSELNASN